MNVSALLGEIALANGGVLTPEAVVATAENKAHPLHVYFDWNNKEAAQKWRIHQARKLIARTTIEIKQGDRMVVVPEYVRDPERNTRQQGYRRTVSVRSEREVALDALRLETDRLRGIMRRTEALAEVLDLRDEYREILDGWARWVLLVDNAA